MSRFRVGSHHVCLIALTSHCNRDGKRLEPACEKHITREPLTIAYLRKFEKTTRKEINQLLLDKLSHALDGKQKRHFITNLLQEMKRGKVIDVDGATRGAEWRLYKTQDNRPD